MSTMGPNCGRFHACMGCSLSKTYCSECWMGKGGHSTWSISTLHFTHYVEVWFQQGQYMAVPSIKHNLVVIFILVTTHSWETIVCIQTANGHDILYPGQSGSMLSVWLRNSNDSHLEPFSTWWCHLWKVWAPAWKWSCLLVKKKSPN